MRTPEPLIGRSRVHPGDLIVYKSGDILYEGEVHHLTVTGRHITCQLLSGQTIPGRAIRGVGIRHADRTLQAAITIRNEEQLMILPDPAISSAPPRPSPVGPHDPPGITTGKTSPK